MLIKFVLVKSYVYQEVVVIQPQLHLHNHNLNHVQTREGLLELMLLHMRDNLSGVDMFLVAMDLLIKSVGLVLKVLIVVGLFNKFINILVIILAELLKLKNMMGLQLLLLTKQEQVI
jgi:hypothetical protein